MQVTVSGQPPRQEPGPPRRRSPRSPLLVLAVLVVGLVTVDQVRAAQSRGAAAVRLVLVAASAPPAGALPAAGSTSTVRDAVVALTVRNEGPDRVRVLQMRLDGGGPTDPGPSLAPGASVVLSVRWRVLCDEIGSLYGPQALDLVVRTPLRAVRPVQIRLGPTSGPIRSAFRTSAVDSCAVPAR